KELAAALSNSVRTGGPSLSDTGQAATSANGTIMARKMSQSTDTNLPGGSDPVVPGGQSPSLEFASKAATNDSCNTGTTTTTTGDDDSASKAATNDSCNTGTTTTTTGDDDSASKAATNDSCNTGTTTTTTGDDDSASKAATNDSCNTGTTTTTTGDDDSAKDNSTTRLDHNKSQVVSMADNGSQTECPVVLNPDPMVVERMTAELSSLRAAISELRQSHKIEVDALRTELHDLRGRLVPTESDKNTAQTSKRKQKAAPAVTPGATHADKQSSTVPAKSSVSQKQCVSNESRPPEVNPQQAETKPKERLEPRAGLNQHTDHEWPGIPELKSNTKTLLLGDSVLRGLHEDKMSVTGSDKCQVISVSGLDRAGLLNRLRCMDPTDVVTTLILHVGINDCKRGYLLGKKSWRDIISAATRCFPAAQIYISSILPLNTQQQTDPCVADSNFCLSEVCESLQVKFIDNDSVFYTRTGEVKSGWYRDAIHPNVRGTSSLAINMKRAFSDRTPSRQTRRAGDAPRHMRDQPWPRPNPDKESAGGDRKGRGPDTRGYNPPRRDRHAHLSSERAPRLTSGQAQEHSVSQAADTRAPIPSHAQQPSVTQVDGLTGAVGKQPSPRGYASPHMGPLLFTSDGRPDLKVQKEKFEDNDIFIKKGIKGKGAYGTVTAYVDGKSRLEFVRKTMKQKEMRPEEVEVLLRLKHRGICRLLAAMFSDGFADILLEDCGIPLAAFSERLLANSVDPKNYWMHVMDVAPQGFEALLYMNGKGILHMDIKPDNCLVRSSSAGNVLVLGDFGSSIIQDKVSDLTTVHWTMEYAAPEVWEFFVDDPNRVLLDLIRMADTYSFGLTVYFMCALSHLLLEERLPPDPFKLIPEAIGSSRWCRPGIPDSLLEVMKGTLQPDRNKRWSNQMAIDCLKGGSGSVGTEKDARAGTITSPASQAKLSQQSSGCAMVPCTVLPADDSTTAVGVKPRKVLIKAGVETSSKDRTVDMGNPEASLSDDHDLPAIPEPSSSGSKPQPSTSRGKGGHPNTSR
ncbi:hypothetical protein BaRGS_00025437, partial [Batillaria attramentaria]